MKFWSNFVIKSKNEFYEVKPFHGDILIKLCFKSTIDAKGNSVEYKYDNLGRKTKIISGTKTLLSCEYTFS